MNPYGGKTMFCQKCGTQNPDDGKFCQKCGNDLKSTIQVERNGLNDIVRDSMVQYKVIAITTGCCAADVNPKEIENRSNELGSRGYELVEAYEAITTGLCCTRKKSSILIFKKS